MRFLIVDVTDKDNGKHVATTRVPLFVLSIIGKHTPDFIYSYILKKLDMVGEEGSTEERDFLKGVVRLLKTVIEDAAVDDQLEKYNGVIMESTNTKDRVLVSII